MPLQPAPHTASEARSAPQMREERVEKDTLSWDPRHSRAFYASSQKVLKLPAGKSMHS